MLGSPAGLQRQSVALAAVRANSQVWEESGEAMEQDFWLALKRFCSAHTAAVEEYFEGLLSHTDMPSVEEAESG